MNQNIILSFVTFLATVATLFVSANISRFEVLDLILVVTSFTSAFAIVLGFMAFYTNSARQKKIKNL